MPPGDWQFYVVTIAALVAFWVLARTIIRPFRRRKPPSRKTTLTVGGRDVSKP